MKRMVLVLLGFVLIVGNISAQGESERAAQRGPVTLKYAFPKRSCRGLSSTVSLHYTYGQKYGVSLIEVERGFGVELHLPYVYQREEGDAISRS
ncbi:MAG: hypothetical protein M0Q37_10860 [Sphaerochaeta sp.]|nr:hypothetical protein [Sphaerochaeta sp.]